MSDLQKQVLKNKLPPPASRNLTVGGNAKRGLMRRRDYTPLSWDKYFENIKDVEVSKDNVFRVYTSGHSGPLLLLLHGGGYSGLSWSLFASNIVSLVDCQVAAVDLRGHGNTHTVNEDDLSAETLSSDVGEVIKALYEDQEVPSIILVGHSMGGAIAVHTAQRELIPSLIGLIVIDVVEGTAMEALQSMQSFLRSRPNTFSSLENAIEWCVRSGQVRNVESARVSMPGQLKSCVTNKTATTDVNSDGSSQTDKTNSNAVCNSTTTTGVLQQKDVILEEEEESDQSDQVETQCVKKAKPSEDDQNNSLSPNQTFKIPSQLVRSAQYTWRIDLSKTENYWSGWFEGLSNLFLSCSVPKLLLLAGVDRLDRDLTIGQMQGKFQMQVLPQCGHAVHEDVPDKVAEAVATYLVRNKFTTPKANFQRTFPSC